jgi:phenylalanyl-tRNA synthetase alpha chain
MDLDKLGQSLHSLERKILPFLRDHITITEISAKSKLKEDEINHALKWLESKGLIELKITSYETIKLDKNAEHYLKNGLPERNIINILKDKPVTLEQLKHSYKERKDDINPGIGALKQKDLIKIEKKGKDLVISLNDNGIPYVIKELPEEVLLKTLSRGMHTTSDIKTYDKNLFETLKKRKEFIKIEEEKTKIITLTSLCKQLLTQKLDQDLIEAITPDIVKSNAWKESAFRRYNVESVVPSVYPGRKYFMNEAISYIRRIWLDMGFKEMEGNMIQPSFWDFDALFVPQDHPAREMQDTFFVEGKGQLPDKETVKKIKNIHETGGDTGSIGWRYKWDENIAKQQVLRTHTTALSILTIASLKKNEIPCKYFSVGKCFRNETLDWKHGFEFYQVEGIVIDENANFRQLLGYLKNYYHMLGFDDIKFRPSYFPYTEASVEVEVYNKERKEWVEFGGAGIFRPEVVKPFLGKEIPVLAWGQGMERGIMSYYDIKDFRDLYKNDLKLLREVKPWLK